MDARKRRIKDRESGVRVINSELRRAAALSKCFRVNYGSKNIVLSVEDLTRFVHGTARGSFQVILPSRHKNEAD